MKILVLGGGGQVARALAATAPAQHEVVARSRGELDIGDEAAVDRELLTGRYDWILNAAAYTAVDRAEDEPELARRVNETAVGHLAQGAARHGGRLLHLSTDFVFDGASSRPYLPTDPTHPLGVYAATKLAGERRVLEAGSSGVVLRTAWVYAAEGKNFVLTMLRLMREREEVRVVCDQVGTPTWATGIARAVWGLVGAAVPGGIHHWTDLGVASWYDFAVAIQEEALQRGLLSRAVPVLPIPTAAYPTRARRPAYSVLDTQTTRALAGAPAHHWRTNLRTMLDELRAA